MIDFRDDINQAIEVLRKGGIILYPTDTIWCLGCDATNSQAVERIHEIKKRNQQKGMLVLLENLNRVTSYVDDVPEVAFDIMELAVKPTTIVYDKAKNFAVNLLDGEGRIAIRITNEPFSQQLIHRFRKPLVATSAKISGQPSPASFCDISETIKSKVDYMVKFRQEETINPTLPSIIQLGSSGLIKIIRK